MIDKRKRSKAYPAADSVKRDESRQIVPVTTRHKVEVIERVQSKSTVRQDRLRLLEDEMLETCLETVRHSLNFADVPFDAQALTDLSEAERSALGPNPERAFRLMKAAQMSSKDAPVGLILAQRTMASIVKSRALEKNDRAPLNASFQVIVAAPVFEEMDVE